MAYISGNRCLIGECLSKIKARRARASGLATSSKWTCCIKEGGLLIKPVVILSRLNIAYRVNTVGDESRCSLQCRVGVGGVSGD